MSFTEYVKGLTRPLLCGMLVVGWICFIAEGINYPASYEAVTLASLAWWGIDRSLLHKKERKND